MAVASLIGWEAFMLEKDWTFWLMMTNYALAVVTALALLLVASAIGWELILRKAQRVGHAKDESAKWDLLLHAGPHGLSVPGLGFTMADGGEKIEPAEAEKKDSKQE
jgi:hypothetical protein